MLAITSVSASAALVVVHFSVEIMLPLESLALVDRGMDTVMADMAVAMARERVVMALPDLSKAHTAINLPPERAATVRRTSATRSMPGPLTAAVARPATERTVTSGENKS